MQVVVPFPDPSTTCCTCTRTIICEHTHGTHTCTQLANKLCPQSIGKSKGTTGTMLFVIYLYLLFHNPQWHTMSYSVVSCHLPTRLFPLCDWRWNPELISSCWWTTFKKSIWHNWALNSCQGLFRILYMYDFFNLHKTLWDLRNIIILILQVGKLK